MQHLMRPGRSRSVKSPLELHAAVARRLARTWSESITSETLQQNSIAAEGTPWPHNVPVGTPDSRSLRADFGSIIDQVAELRSWAEEHSLQLLDRSRYVGSIIHSIPSHAVVPNIDVAAQLSGREWVARLERGRARAREIARRFPVLERPQSFLRAADPLSDADFELLLEAGRWFTDHSAEGLTPRQVPLEGFHAKWLNTRQSLVAALATRESLSLAPNHPARIHFTYIDPGHLRSGGRRHDSATVGDRFQPAYKPRVILISENKDTAINFPTVRDGISVEGVGRGGSTIASFDWIMNADLILYWGDIDADGFEILDGFRAAGLRARSILMDKSTYDRWHRFGASTDARGIALTGRVARKTPHLTAEERELYLHVCDPELEGVRRIEQERIPLSKARDMVEAVIRRELDDPARSSVGSPIH